MSSMWCVKYVAVLLVVGLYSAQPLTGERCEDCSTVHRYINASGNNYITYELCLGSSSCNDHCLTGYDLRMVAIAPQDSKQHVKVYWNTEQVYLEILSSFADDKDMTVAHDLVMDITYICYERVPPDKLTSVTVTLKPISVELHINSSHGEVHEGQSMLLTCTISGPFNKEISQTIIHHQDVNDTELSCTYSDVTTDDVNGELAETLCITTVHNFSKSDGGRYFCTVTIGEKYFPSNAKEVKLYSNGNTDAGLGQIAIAIIVAISILAALLGSLVIILIVSHLILFIKRRQLDDDERIPIIHMDQNEHREYDGCQVERDLVGHGGRTSPANSNHSEDSDHSRDSRGSRGSRRSARSHPESNLELPAPESNSKSTQV